MLFRSPERDQAVTVLYFGSILDITLDPIGTQPLPPVLFGVPQQRQVRAAAVALVDSRVPLKLNSGPYAGEPAGKNDGFRRSRTCMVPSAPEAWAHDFISGMTVWRQSPTLNPHQT